MNFKKLLLPNDSIAVSLDIIDNEQSDGIHNINY